jgi:hypothetical protein
MSVSQKRLADLLMNPLEIVTSARECDLPKQCNLDVSFTPIQCKIHLFYFNLHRRAAAVPLHKRRPPCITR